MSDEKPKRPLVGLTSKTPPQVSAAAATILPIVDTILTVAGHTKLTTRPDREDIYRFVSYGWRAREQLFRIKMKVNPNGTPPLLEKLVAMEQWVRAHPDIFGESTTTFADSLHAATEAGIAAELYLKPEKPGQETAKKSQNTWIGGF